MRSIVINPKPPDASAAAKAFEETEAERRALTPEEILSPNLDITRAVQTALGVVLWIRGAGVDLKKALPHHDVSVDELERYALAAVHANALDLPESGAPEVRQASIDEALALREDILRSAELLARRGVLDAATVAAIRSGKGNLDLANDLIGLGELFRAHWSDIVGKTPITREDVDRASALGVELLTQFAERERAAADPQTRLMADERARAFTLLDRAYDEWRRAIGYVRWHEGDAAILAPSLRQNRGPRRSPAAPPAPEPPVPTPDNGSPSPQNG